MNKLLIYEYLLTLYPKCFGISIDNDYLSIVCFENRKDNKVHKYDDIKIPYNIWLRKKKLERIINE